MSERLAVIEVIDWVFEALSSGVAEAVSVRVSGTISVAVMTRGRLFDDDTVSEPLLVSRSVTVNVNVRLVVVVGRLEMLGNV